MKDGKIVEDDMGHAVDFTEFVNKTAEGLYTFKASSDRTSPEDKGGQGGTGGKGGAAGGKKYLSKKPANYEELSKTYEAIEADNSLKPDEKIKVQAELNEIYSGSKQVAV
jgi:hypothetical protein